MKTMEEFIEENADFIDYVIRGRVPNFGEITDDDRDAWVSNTEALYNIAKNEGVDI